MHIATCPTCTTPISDADDRFHDYRCPVCGLTLTAIGTLTMNHVYQCRPSTRARIFAAIATDLTAHGFAHLVISSRTPNNTIPYIIWGRHQDATVQTHIESTAHRGQLYCYQYVIGDILRYCEANDTHYDPIVLGIRAWMQSHGTTEVRYSPLIYRTPAYYASQRAKQRTQRQRQNYNLTAGYVRQITTLIERIDKKIDDYTTTYGEPLPVEYITVRIPTF
jgi:hypothetical protein